MLPNAPTADAAAPSAARAPWSYPSAQAVPAPVAEDFKPSSLNQVESLDAPSALAVPTATGTLAPVRAAPAAQKPATGPVATGTTWQNPR